MQADILDVTLKDFQSVIAQGSVNKPVLAVFWSPHCAICKSLLLTLEQLQREHANGFTLAKINGDVEQQIVQHFDIKSVPTAYMFVNGQGVDGFAGEQSIDVINAFIKKHLPDLAQKLLAEAQTLFAQGQINEAKKTLLQAQKINTDEVQITLSLAQVYLALGEFESAKPLLMSIPVAEQNMIYHSLISELAQIEKSTQTPEIIALEKALLTAIDKKPIEYQLATQYKQTKRYEEALKLLMALLTHDINYDDGKAKKMILTMLESVDNPTLVSAYRRKLYSLLY